MSTPPLLSSHRICIAMSEDGRCLRCRVCFLTFSFPSGTQYDTVAKQFDAHYCQFPSRIAPGARLVARKELTDRRLLILRYERKVPVMGSCARCELKFFVPTTLSRDGMKAEAYLGQRFASHRCQETER